MSTLKGSQLTGFIDGAAAKVTFGATGQNLGTTALANTLIMCLSIVSSDNVPVTVVSITDNAGMHWHKAKAHSHAGLNQSGITSGPVTQNLEIWYAQANAGTLPTSGYDFTITVNDDNVDSLFYDLAASSGFDRNRPLDLNANASGAQDYYNTGSASVLTFTLDTDTANQTVVSVFGGVGPGQRPMNSGNAEFNGVGHADYGTGTDTFHLNQNYNVVATGKYDTTSAWSGASLENSSAINNPIGIFVVFTADDQSTNSYANFGGTGDRRDLINIWSNVGSAPSDDSQGLGTPWSGTIDGSSTSGPFFNAANAVSGKSVFQFDFLCAPRVIDEVTLTLDRANSTGEVMQWQGSADGVAWDDLGDPVTFVGTVITYYLGGNDTAYQSYRMLGVSGNTTTTPNFSQFEFKIDSAVSSSGGFLHAVATPSQFNNSLGTTVAITTTLDAWLVLIVECNKPTGIGHPAVSTVTDDNGNTWTRRDGHEATLGSNWQFVEYWYARQTTGDTTTVTVSMTSTTDSANASLIAFANLPDMSTPWQTTTGTAYDYTGGPTIPTLNYPDITGLGIAIVSAVTPGSSATIQSDQGYDHTGLELLKIRNNGFLNWAYGNHSLMVIGGTSGTPVDIRGTTTALVMFSDVINLGSGGPSPDGNASGTISTVTVSLLPGDAAKDGDADGDTIVVTTDIFTPLPGAVLPVVATLLPADVHTTPIDGSKLFEFTPSQISSLIYQVVDYDSIWSRGDRVNNGLVTSGEYGWDHVFAGSAQAFDNAGIAAGLGNGPDQTGSAFGASFWWSFADDQPVDLRGLRSIGKEQHEDFDVMWALYGGSGPGDTAPQPYTQGFDGFPVVSSDVYPGTIFGSDVFANETLFNPRIYVAYSHYEIKLVTGTRVDDRLCNEFWFAVAHSNLDGGDRRPSAPAEKRVAFSFSADFQGHAASGGFGTPQEAFFDGKYDIETGTLQSALGSAANLNNPVTTVGAWLQYVFPRPVTPRHIMFVNANNENESYTGDDPTKFGIWHWEYSANGGATWIPVGDPWSFREGCTWMVAPKRGLFGLPPVFEGDNSGASRWRMVLDQGPAFGLTVASHLQIMFDLEDTTGQAPPLEIGFTDDNAADSNPLPTATIGSPGSPYVVAFTDGNSDVLSLTLTNIPNPILSVAFTDGTSDRLDFQGDLFPSQVVQTFVKTNGRN